MIKATRSGSTVDDSKFDERLPDLDNQSDSDLGFSIDAICDRLEYAVHRTGLTPRLKILMAALRRAMDFGDVKFTVPGKRPVNLLRFMAEGGPLKVYKPANHEPTYTLPTPAPTFSVPRPRF
jgi:hypothetical protein